MTNADIDTAFVDAPPEGFLPWSQKTLALIQLASKKAGVDLENIAILVGCYYLVSNGMLKPTEDEIMEQIAIISDKDFDDAVAYIGRITERMNAASVETDTPGK